MTVAEKIKHVAELEGLTLSKMEREIGCSSGVLRKSIVNNNDPNTKWVISFLKRFPKISSDWLILDIGEMYRINDHEAAITNTGNFGDDGIQMNVSGGKNKVKMDGSVELQKFKSENKMFIKRIQELESDNKLLREQNSQLTNTVLELAKGKNI